MPDIRLTNVTVEADIQCRARSLDQGHVDDLAAALTAGAKLPPVVVYKTPNGTIYLSEGFHRIEAYRRAGREFLPAEVRDGTRDDAKLNAMASNQGHGLKRTNEDKRRAAVEVLKLKPEWSDRRIAEHIGVSNNFVSDLRRQVSSDDTSAEPKREGKDGKTYPKTQPPKTKPAIPQEVTAEPVNQPQPESDDDTEQEDKPDWITVESLKSVAREQADNGDYEAAAETQREAEELAEKIADDATVSDSDPSDDFCSLVAGMCRELDDLARRVADLKASPYARFVHWQSAQVQVKNARETLWGGRPTHCCPYCRVAGEPQPECRCCGGLNVTTKSSYKAGVAAVGGGEQ